MSIYYNIIDPIIFVSTLLLCIIGIILIRTNKDRNSLNESLIYKVAITASILLTLFITINFRIIYNIQNKKNTGVEAMYKYFSKYGTTNIRPDITFILLVLGLFSAIFAIVLIMLGIVFIRISEDTLYKYSGNDIVKKLLDKKLDKKLQIYFLITGIMCIICGILVFIRLPLEYFLSILGIQLFMSRTQKFISSRFTPLKI